MFAVSECFWFWFLEQRVGDLYQTVGVDEIEAANDPPMEMEGKISWHIFRFAENMFNLMND